MRKIIILLSSIALVSCTSVKEVYVIPMSKDEMAKATVKNKKDSYHANVSVTSKKGKDPQIVNKPAVVEVYDIGPTIAANGDAIGKHQYYRIVEKSHLALKSGHEPGHDPIQVKPQSQKDQFTQAIEEVKQARRETAALRNEVNQIRAIKNQGGSAGAPQLAQPEEPMDPGRQLVEEAFSPMKKPAPQWKDPTQDLNDFKPEQPK